MAPPSIIGPPTHFTFPLWQGNNNCAPHFEFSTFTVAFGLPVPKKAIPSEKWSKCESLLWDTVACSRSAISRSFVITHLHYKPNPNVLILLFFEDFIFDLTALLTFVCKRSLRVFVILTTFNRYLIWENCLPSITIASILREYIYNTYLEI